MKRKNTKAKAKQDEVAQWPFIRWIEGRQRWMVDTRTAEGGERKFYTTKTEAEGAAVIARTKRQNEGGSAFDDAELASYGWTIQRAIKFTVDHLRRQRQSVPLASAVTTYLEFKRSRVGARRHLDMTQRLGRIKTALGEKTELAHLTADHLNAFLEAIAHPATRNDYRKELVALWRYAGTKPREWTAVKLDNLVLPRAKEPDKARVILTVDQAAALMEASKDPEVRALNAMVLFAGIRREEVEKLDWAKVDFRTGHIDITADISKVNTERFAPISDNLRAWIEPIAKKSGPVVTRHLMHPLRRTWKAAGIYPWPQDAHRHSFISYRRQLVGDSKTALEAGTSEAIIKRHYKRPVLESDAKAFFAIKP